MLGEVLRNLTNKNQSSGTAYTIQAEGLECVYPDSNRLFYPTYVAKWENFEWNGPDELNSSELIQEQNTVEPEILYPASNQLFEPDYDFDDPSLKVELGEDSAPLSEEERIFLQKNRTIDHQLTNLGTAVFGFMKRRTDGLAHLVDSMTISAAGAPRHLIPLYRHIDRD